MCVYKPDEMEVWKNIDYVSNVRTSNNVLNARIWTCPVTFGVAVVCDVAVAGVVVVWGGWGGRG